MDSAMNMLDADRYERFTQDYTYISSLSLSQWLADFLVELCFSDETDTLPVPTKFASKRDGSNYQELTLQSWTAILDPTVLYQTYQSHQKRLLIFDLDSALLKNQAYGQGGSCGPQMNDFFSRPDPYATEKPIVC